jgi:hypothetical protein
MTKPAIHLRVIPEPEPETRVIFRHAGPNPLVSGSDGSAPDLCCGTCGSPLVTGIAKMVFYNIVFFCHVCGAFNELMLRHLHHNQATPDQLPVSSNFSPLAIASPSSWGGWLNTSPLWPQSVKNLDNI